MAEKRKYTGKVKEPRIVRGDSANIVRSAHEKDTGSSVVRPGCL